MAARRRNVVGEVMEEESQRRKLETGLAKGEGGGLGGQVSGPGI